MVSTRCSCGAGRPHAPGAAVWAALLLAGLGPSQLANAEPDAQDLAVESMRALLSAKVTTVSRKAQRLSRVPAAVYVVTAEDIRRSGVSSIPEALRMVPGLQVARISASQWAISARGFNGRWANKLLVLIDGRTVYSPIFAGVYWDVQDTMLKDIDRIEVIRGPGAAIWGANAVNGIINIVTKKAVETQGGYLALQSGNERHAQVTARYGGALSPNTYYRAYGKYFQTTHSETALGPAFDGWSMGRGGFRMDWQRSPKTAVTVQGDAYTGRADELAIDVASAPPYSAIRSGRQTPRGGNVLARWTRAGADGSETEVQAYFDTSRRWGTVSGESVNTWDIDVQRRLRRLSRHDIQFGVEARFSGATLRMPPGLVESRQDPLGDYVAGAFIQDEIGLIEDRLALVLGLKLERTGYSGSAWLPAVQMAWSPSDRHTVWISAARAVRTPSLVDRAAVFFVGGVAGPGGMPAFAYVMGNPELKSERVMAYEVGYRVVPVEWLSLDWTGFYNVYDDLRTSEIGIPYLENIPLPPHLVIPIVPQNELAAKSYGSELAATVQPLARWKLSAGHSWQGISLRQSPRSSDADTDRLRADLPRHQVQLRSYLDLPWGSSLDAMLFRVGQLPEHNAGIARPAIPAYTRVDLRAGRALTEAIDLSAGVQDLLNREHLEFIEGWGASTASETGRRLYGKVSVRF